MAQYHIYHATGEHRFQEVDRQARDYAGFVEASSLEEAFAKSQNLDEPWNPVFPCRSTSVGDVIQDDNGLHMVCNIGFKQLVQA